MGIPCVGGVLSLALVLLAGVPLPLGKWANIRQFPYFVRCPWHFTVVVPLNPNNNHVRWKLWSPLYRWENQDKERTRNSFRFPSQWVVELCQPLSPYSLDQLFPPSCLRPVSLLWLSNCVSFVLFLAPVSQASRTTFERPDQPIRVFLASDKPKLLCVLGAGSTQPCASNSPRRGLKRRASGNFPQRGVQRWNFFLSFPILKPSGTGAALWTGLLRAGWFIHQVALVYTFFCRNLL